MSYVPFFGLVRELRRQTDAELVNFDWVGEWSVIQWLYRPFAEIFDHRGSESWADHLGLRGFHDNSVKARRRKIASFLSVGHTDRWVRARGLGSPPD
jgi:hypothetical protein